jgi:hypothetical protein
VVHVNKSIISKDMVHLKQQARNNLQKHIHETIPAEYQKTCNTLNQVLRITRSIVSMTEDEEKVLINDVNKYRTWLVTNGVIVNDTFRIVQSKMDHLSGEEKRFLHKNQNWRNKKNKN